ncbi:MAG: glycoside hydrolase family 13 protein [Saprospiraceae bacterium]|nr:glycoside hydrolase family 13 protein [Saprospiraceae bacterium]
MSRNLLSTLLACFLTLSLSAQEMRVEPPFWWTGMKNPALQLMVHAPRISEWHPSVSYPGLRMERVIRTENPNYLFIDLLLLDGVQPGKFTIEFKKDGKVMHRHTYELLQREPGSAERQGFTPADVMYLITPDRFVNGNPANDNVAGMREKADRKNIGGRHGGDIAGILQSLDYLDDMGFTAIWVNPVLENDMQEYSYHGYSTTDFYKADPRFGSNEDYRNLSMKAKDKGIKMIMDMIVNHCGSEHWWMRDLPAADWLNYQSGFVGTIHRKSVLQDPYVAAIDLERMVDGWFVPTMPDLNQRNPLMATYLIQNTIWWVEYAWLSGIRMDTYPYPDKHFMSDWTCAVMQEYPNFNIVGEEWTENPALVAYWQRGKTNPDGYTSCLPGLMDFPLQGALRRGLTEPSGWGEGFMRLYEMLANDFLYADPANFVIFPDNHDMSRFFTQMNEDYDLFRMGMIYTYTMRGIPQIYYGTEILMTNPGTDDHGIIRSDFPGGWAGDAVNAFTGAGLTARQKEAQELFRKLGSWRKQSPVIHHGKLKHYLPENDTYVYFRYDDQRKVMVVMNRKTEPVNLPLARFSEMIAGARSAKDVLSGQSFPLGKMLTVPARQALILELE